MAADPTQRARAQVEKWRDELLDLTGRNRLLRFRHTKTSSLEVVSPSGQEVVDRLLTGRAREWAFHLPEELAEGADVDPTAAVLGLGDENVNGSEAEPVLDALNRLGATDDGDAVWLSFGVVRWRDTATHSAALLLVPAELHHAGGRRLRLRAEELVVNPALIAHFERHLDVDLGEERYRIESAGIQSYLDALRGGLTALEPQIDDRIGLISALQHEAMLAGELDVTPTVLISESPRDGVLAAIAGADAAHGLPLLPATARVPSLRTPKASGGPPLLHTTKTTAKDVNAACAALARRTAQEYMDKGIWILYLGIGMLHWSDPADGRAEFQDSPLLLVPVRIESAKGGTKWRMLSSEEDPLVNPALWLKLESDLEIELPEIEPDEPIDVKEVLAAVRDAIAAHPTWTVEERVVISIFSFHKEAMYRDLRDNLEKIVTEPIVSALAGEPGLSEPEQEDFYFDPVAEEQLDLVAPPERARTILDADASQRQCIAAAIDGHSFVMDGAPGTGKSQTIANQIAELIAAGKTVLFVSEKAAALDVVYDRLALLGLDDYVLELHSHKTTRAAVAASLGGSLQRRPIPAPALTDHDLDDAERRRLELTRYAEALNDPVEQLGGRSLHHLLGLIAALQHLPQAPVAAQPLADAEQLGTIRELSAQLSGSWDVIDRGDDFLWRGASTRSWSASVEQEIQAAVGQGLTTLEALGNISGIVAADLLLVEPAGPAAAAKLAAVARHLSTRPDVDVPPEWLTDIDRADLTAASSRTAIRLRAIKAAEARAFDIAGSDWRDVTARPEPARRLKTALQADGLDIPADARAADLRRLAGIAGDIASAADEARATARDLTALLGLRAADLTASDIDNAIGLVAIAGGTDRPTALWLTSRERLTHAWASYNMVAPPAAAAQEARSRAAAFEESALDLDLTSLATRFHEQHRGVKKLGSAYRTDRDALAATAPGLSPKQAIDQVDHAKEWQDARRALDAVVQSHGSALDDAWDGPATDLDALRRRLEAASSAWEHAGDRVVDLQRFAEQVSGARTPEALAGPGAQAESATARLRSATPSTMSPMLSLPLDTAAERLTAARSMLLETAELVESVDEARGRPTSMTDALDLHEAIGEAAMLIAKGEDDTEAHEDLGPHWSAATVDPEALERATRWAVDVQVLLDGSISRRAAQRLVSMTPAAADLDRSLSQWNAGRDRLLSSFQTSRRSTIAADLDADFSDARALLERLRDTRGDIEIWIAYADAVRALRDVGLEPAVRYCIEQRVPASQLVGVLRRSVLEATADAQLADRATALGPLRSVDRNRLVREFAGMDRRVVGDAAHRVMGAANARRPRTVVGIAAIIAHEAQKKRRHMPVAMLLAKTAAVAQAIKPCFMMSPLSVSQFLSPEMRFDVVIFDEASQVRPSDAINALYRGDAMIVAGDQKQLPPSSFFDRTTDDGDEWTEDELAEFGSILDLAKASGAFRSLPLKWHYRSRHENLIAFSNYRFYRGELVTFPSPAETADDLGVQLIPVDGAYRRGTSKDNPVEARTVVDRVFWHAERGTRSIGVVAFSEAQASLIDEVLRLDPRREDPRFTELFGNSRLNSLFVKNLENVQGDERDVIIFSVGYGPDEHGKLTMNFGPITYEGGWRRLNVAITRARRRVEIICSFGAEQLVRGSHNRSVDELRRYLEFAQHGPASLAIADGLESGGEAESPFEEAVLRSIRDFGYDVVSQVGTAGYRIDMAVRRIDNPGRFALGIECDGAMYHSSRVARDRDRLRQQVLEGLGWTLHRIWGPSWYRDRAGEESRLKEAIERAMLHAPTSALQTEAEPPILVDFEEIDLQAPPAWVEPYTIARLPQTVTADPADASADPEIRKLAQQVVAEEGPIVGDLLARRVISAWEVMVTGRRRKAVERNLAQLKRAGTLVLDGNAYRSPAQRTTPVRAPVDGDEDTQREVRHVPDVELAEAIIRLVTDARLVSDDEAATQTARLFGWRRNGLAIRTALARVIDQLIDEGRLARDGDSLRIELDNRADPALG
jgi:very-short-patch-repair endonuclease